jgi:hypothetical protein
MKTVDQKTALGLIEVAIINDYMALQLRSIGLDAIQYQYSLSPFIEAITGINVEVLENERLDDMFGALEDQVNLIKEKHLESGVDGTIDKDVLREATINVYADWRALTQVIA